MDKKKSDCKKYNNCSAPLCPIDEVSLKEGIFYPDEEICGARNFQSLDWIKKQKLVAKADACQDKYFTVDMLTAAKQIRKGIEGIDPDQTLDSAYKAEQSWIVAKKKGRVIADKPKKTKRAVAKKKNKSADAGKKRAKKSAP